MKNENSQLLTTRQVAEKLGISDARIRQLIYNGRLPSQKIGNNNLVYEKDLHLLENRQPGRPKKDKTETN